MNVEGRNPVVELLKTDKPVKKIYIQLNINRDEKIEAIINKAHKRRIELNFRSRKELDRLSHTGEHQGVIAIARHIQKQSCKEIVEMNFEKKKFTRLIYIRESFHEYNIGAIIRTAECAGFDAVILPPKISLTPQIVRASMGAAEHIPVLSEGLFPLIKFLHSYNYKVVGIERTENAIIHSEADLTGDIMLIIGGEDKSLSEEIVSRCDEIVMIPMSGKVNSLNMSVASAVVIYEVIRQNSAKR